jgi:branched-chain amino acid transport system substrate-binding protein
MKALKTIVLLVVILMLALPGFSAGKKEVEPEVNLGLIFAMTGPGSALGIKQMDAAKLAVQEINDRGGVNLNGTRVMINAIAQDTETKPDAAIRKMKSMVQSSNVTAVAGGTFAHVSMAMNDQSIRTPVVFCSVNGVPEEFFMKKNKGPYSFSTMADVTSMGRGAAAYVTEVLNMKKIVVLLPDYAYGHGARRGIEEVLSAAPGVTYSIIMTPVGTADMTPYLIRAKEERPDIIMMGQWGSDAINILKQAYDMNLRKDTKLFYNWIVDVFATGIPAEALEGVYCQMYWYHDMSGFYDPEVIDASLEFSKKYEAAYGEPCDPYAMSAYYAVMEIVRGMELAGSTDPEKVYNALMDNPNWVSAKGPAK